MNNKKLNAVHVWKKSEEGRAEARPYKVQTTTARNKKVDAGRVWKQFEDDVVPQLRLSVFERAVYSYLLRRSRLEGKTRICFSVLWLAKGTRLSLGTTRKALYRLFDQGALRLGDGS